LELLHWGLLEAERAEQGAAVVALPTPEPVLEPVLEPAAARKMSARG